MNKERIGLALELINGLGKSYKEVAYLCCCHPSTLKKFDKEYMCYKFKGEVITLQSKINNEAE